METINITKEDMKIVNGLADNISVLMRHQSPGLFAENFQCSPAIALGILINKYAPVIEKEADKIREKNQD